jgi:hypothetical protein
MAGNLLPLFIGLPTLLGYVSANYQTKLRALTVALSSQQLLNVNWLFKL